MITIKRKFILAGALAFITTIGILVLVQYSAYKARLFDVVNLQISQVKEGMLTLRRNEKDFIARNDLKYKKKFEANHLKLEEKTKLLKAAVAKAGLDTTNVTTMESSFKEYKQSFLKLVTIQQKIGLNHNDGLRGVLREAVHQAEGQIYTLGEYKLSADMLQLRRNEKDFMLRLDMKYLQKFNDNLNLFLQGLANSRVSIDSKEAIAKFMEQYNVSFQELVKNNQLKGLSSKEGILGAMRSRVHKSEGLLEELSAYLNTTIKEEIGSLNRYKLIINAIGFLLALSILAIMTWLARSVVLPLEQLAKTMTQAANENNLSLQMTVITNDEIGETSLAFNSMLKKFKEIIGEVNSSATQIASAAEETSCIASQNNEGMQKQKAETSELVMAMNKMTFTTEEVSKNALVASDTASQADTETTTGREVVNKAAETINVLSGGIERAATAIQRVANDSQKIGSVMDVIRDIAEQTNLLALNAAIEAARAGEQGRGFAVVADEVRTLAGRTQESTQEIKQMIESLQAGSREAVQLMNESSDQTQTGVEQTSKADRSLIDIVNAVNSINDINTYISNAAEEQLQVVKEFNCNVEAINEIGVLSIEGAEQTTQASKDLARLAVDLHELVRKFKI